MLTMHIEEAKTRTKHTKTCENSRIFTKRTWHYKSKHILEISTTKKQKNKLEEQKTAMKNNKEVKEVYTELYKDPLSTSLIKNTWQKTV